MLHSNLATRPFYNERVVYLALAVVAAIVAALTVFNVVQVARLSARNTAVEQRIADDEARAADLLRRAQETRARLGDADRQAALGAAREANAIIDQRTFSWTELFNRIELTIPPDVMVRSIRPEIVEDRVTLTLTVLGEDVAAVETFMAALEATGAFTNVLSREEQMTDEGLISATLVSSYRPGIQPESSGPDGGEHAGAGTVSARDAARASAGSGDATREGPAGPVARRAVP